MESFLGAISALISASVCAMAEDSARQQRVVLRNLFMVIVFTVRTAKVRKVMFLEVKMGMHSVQFTLKMHLGPEYPWRSLLPIEGHGRTGLPVHHVFGDLLDFGQGHDIGVFGNGPV